MKAIKISGNGKAAFLYIKESYEVGHYRGEDSGAIYPEYEYKYVEGYNLTPILTQVVNGKTISELVEESNRFYPYAGEMFTSDQARKIYTYIQRLANIDDLRISDLT